MKYGIIQIENFVFSCVSLYKPKWLYAKHQSAIT